MTKRAKRKELAKGKYRKRVLAHLYKIQLMLLNFRRDSRMTGLLPEEYNDDLNKAAALLGPILAHIKTYYERETK